MTAPIITAGALPWRVRAGKLQVAVIHRPRYDDWSWPKGKLDPGEALPVTAVREVWEETGLRVRLGIPLPRADYLINGSGNRKIVHYWAAEITGGAGRLLHEVDQVRWLEPDAARRRLSYDRDREQLDALLTAHRGGTLAVRPYAVVRHAKAIPRRKWSSDDWLRPLDERGLQESLEMIDMLLAYGSVRLLSSSATRCVQTLTPYAKATRLPLETSYALSEEGFEKRPKQAIRVLRSHLTGARPGAICSHGPVLPALLKELAKRASGRPRHVLKDAASDNLEKGEVLICHLDKADRVVAVEHHPPA